MNSLASLDLGTDRPGHPGVLGAVLAGGRSIRMGRDKAGLRVQGEPLLLRQLRLLEECGVGRRIVSAGVQSAGGVWDLIPAAVAFVRDSAPDQGPLAGLEQALAAALPSETHVLAVAVDLPCLTVDWLQSRIMQCRPGVGVVGSIGDQLEPLAAVYPVEGLASLRRRITRGELAVNAWVREGIRDGWMIERPLPPSERSLLQNWNHPSDLPVAEG